jgi:hypothetical protein
MATSHFSVLRLRTVSKAFSSLLISPRYSLPSSGELSAFSNSPLCITSKISSNSEPLTSFSAISNNQKKADDAWSNFDGSVSEIIKKKKEGERVPSYLEEPLYYIENKEKIEKDFTDYFAIQLDVLFGGVVVSFSSSMFPVSEVQEILIMMYPEIKKTPGSIFEKEDLIFIFKNKDTIQERIMSVKDRIGGVINFDVSKEEELLELKSEIEEYLLELTPIIKDMIENDNPFFELEEVYESDYFQKRKERNIEILKKSVLAKDII